MGGCWSGDAGRGASRTERSNSSEVKSPRRSRDFIRHWADSSRGESSRGLEANPALREFKEAFQNEIEPKDDNGILISSDGYSGNYCNKIYSDRGKIIGIDNNRYKDMHLSDVVYSQILTALEEDKKSISGFNLKILHDKNVTNEDTLKAVDEVGIGTFFSEDWQFSKILNSQTGKSKSYLARDHFPNKSVAQIIITPNDLETVDIKYIYE